MSLQTKIYRIKKIEHGGAKLPQPSRAMTVTVIAFFLGIITV